MATVLHNLFANLATGMNEEEILPLMDRDGTRVERIASNGQGSPDGFWYDQDTEEWVALLRGTATLKFADGEILEMSAGDYLTIAPHVRHRVERTSRDAVWLAVHLK